ncbi:Elongation factor [Trichinella spiralis]|uniref:Elongation factor n=1 Tax=Trichinella spiralis TaxID=6334 RepID=A0ABR3KII1_TRISP
MSGGNRFQIIRAFAHGNGGEKMVLNCLFDRAAERSFTADVARKLACEPLVKPPVWRSPKASESTEYAEVVRQHCLVRDSDKGVTTSLRIGTASSGD